MKDTGAALWIAENAITALEKITPNIDILRWFISVFLTGVLTNLLSNATTVAVIGPIVLNMGGDPIIIGFSTGDRVLFCLPYCCCLTNLYDNSFKRIGQI